MSQVANVNNFKLRLSEASQETEGEIISSIGGDITTTTMPSGMNNLFNDVSSDKAKNGQTDYRCIYAINTSLNDAYFYNILLTSSPSISIGTVYRDNVEKFSFDFSIPLSPINPNRSFTFEYGSYDPIYLIFNDNINVFTANVQAAIRQLPEFEHAIVTSGETRSGSDITSRYFQINIPLRSILDNGICENVNIPNVVISKTNNVKGSPINAMAENIFSPINPPSSVNFSSSLIEFEKLGPHETFYFWIRRITPPNSPAAISATGQISVRLDLTES